MRKRLAIAELLCLALTLAACAGGQGKMAASENMQVSESKTQEEAQDLGQQGMRQGQEEIKASAPGMMESTVHVQETGEIITTSEWKTSYRGIVGEEMDVVYLGKPRKLKAEQAGESEWTSSDESIATVREGIVTGWREGLVTITQRQGKNVIGEWRFAVTTFNDGRQAASTYELERNEIEALLSSEGGVLEPEFWQQKLNTIQDVITYFQVCGFQYSGDIPVLATQYSYWLCYVPAEVVLFNNFGYSDDMTDAAAYLLQNDFEDWGYVYVMGSGLKHKCWFYEDGIYTYVDFAQLARDLRDDKREEDYEPYQTDSLDELAKHVTEGIDRENTLTVLMIPALGNDFMPPSYISYIHDSSEIYHTHVVIGLEDDYAEKTKVLFSNPDFDFEVTGIPTEEIPDGVPKCGDQNGYQYPYE